MDRYFARVMSQDQPEDCEPEDWESIRALSPELAAQELIAQREHWQTEFPVASGNEYAKVEVKGHGRFLVEGDPRPHYIARPLIEGGNGDD